ncbi:hypothetical protein pdul_cds_43 [Pandoravirus dulcis]|uniref:Uncharacterized protein n=1 Tax=Pandoravirus dulcis TaxID=1349409 RepID=S4VVC0_9VIRU|nr:hypothetical protein pdul_cds_43 [Pandoravirus dulcis]AGO81919.1 hypothetical protein pdul_cds_43 [Pandoravirus dulcis]
MQRATPAIAGTKRTREAVRPEVAAAMGLCAQQADLSDGQRQRLAAIAVRLGVPPSPGNPCAALAHRLGSEWTDAAAWVDLFAAEEARRTRGPAAVDDDGRGAGNDGGGNQTLPSPHLTSADWGSLPLEMRAEIARVLADVDPRAAVDLYMSGPEAARAFAGQTHAALGVDGKGVLIERRVPLIDYARAAAVFGVTDPLDLFLAGATCSLQALANWYTVAPHYAGAFAPPGHAATRDPTATDYADLVSEGLSIDALDATLIDRLAEAARSLAVDRPATLRDVRAAFAGPVPGSVAEVARQWYDYVQRPSTLRDARPVPTRDTIVSARFKALGVAVPRAGVDLFDRAVEHGIALPVPGDADDWDLVSAMRLVGPVPPDNALAWLRPTLDSPDEIPELEDWIAGRPLMVDADGQDIVDRLKDKDAVDGEEALHALLDDVQAAIEPYVCQAYFAPSHVVPPFAWLLTASRALLAQHDGRVWLFFQPRSQAIEQALALAAAQSAP